MKLWTVEKEIYRLSAIVFHFSVLGEKILVVDRRDQAVITCESFKWVPST